MQNSENDDTQSTGSGKSADTGNIIILLDDWKDCNKFDKECVPPPQDPRYDLNQLKIFEAYAMNLSYSEVGLKVIPPLPDPPMPIKPIEKTIINPKVKIALQQQLTGAKPFGNHRGGAARGDPIENNTNSPEGIRKTVPPELSNPVIIFHDLFRSQSEWQAFAADLAELVQRRCIVVDLRNHGTSPFNTSSCGLREYMTDMRNFFREIHLAPSKCSIIAHGMSAWCVMVYCLIHPYKVRNLIMVESSPNDNPYFTHDISKLRKALSRIQTPPMGKSVSSLRVRIGEFLEKFVPNVNVRSFVIQNTVVPEVVGKPEKWNRRRNEIIESLESFTRFPDFLQMFNFDKPILFVGSSTSKYLRREDEPKIKKLFPQAEFTYYSKDTKSPHVDYYDYFLDIVKTFLSRDMIPLESDQ